MLVSDHILCDVSIALFTNLHSPRVVAQYYNGFSMNYTLLVSPRNDASSVDF